MRRVLVANRGEIAVRIARTCKALGLECVAVAAADDAASLHARVADTVVPIASYLDPSEHLRAARLAGADAIHPGYGFLAESPAFAQAVLDAGLTWVGPPPRALQLGGNKVDSKRIAGEAGVPVVEAGDPAELGYPLLVKAAAGGGGRGMRVVRREADLAEALEAAGREALAAFGDGTLFCERYVERPRHVEVQLLADSHGTVAALGERECSVQRRHQKVLEESPSSALTDELRGRMSDAAIAFARAIGYVGAGTAEFMVSGDSFSFLELNARIQVEHPVTESVTGVDLIAEQLRIAMGQPIAAAVQPAGHAIEVRLYAEHPRSFLPQTGTLERLVLPTEIRVDSGVAEGDRIGTAYDPLIAKLIAWGPTREAARRRLGDALARTAVVGITTNLAFLRWLVAHPCFAAGETTTAFLAEHPPLSRYPSRPRSGAAPDTDGFRLNLAPVAYTSDLDVDDHEHDAAADRASGVVTAPMPGRVLRIDIATGDNVEGKQVLMLLEAMKMEIAVTAPYHGVVADVLVAEGAQVAAGQTLLEIES